MLDHQYMHEAIRLALKGQYTTRPNPAVGCVIVKDDKVIGKGWHHKAGDKHAEVYALEKAGAKAKGATVYVTLEPCSHKGKTPPCVKSLIKNKVARVVIAMQDPNPQVDGKGIRMLKEAGIKVEVGFLEEAAQQLNQGFIYAMQHGKSFVRAKMAMSLDGRTAMASGQSKWITSDDARLDGQKLRARSGAIITGASTVMSDNPHMTVRTDSWPNAPEELVPPPIRVVLDSRMRVAPTSCVFQGEGKKWLVCAQADAEKMKAFEKAGVQVHVIPDKDGGKVDISALMIKLFEAKCYDVLIEAGPTLLGDAISAGVVDELWSYLAPKVMGQDGKPMAILPEMLTIDEHVPLSFKNIVRVGPDVRIISTLT